MNSYLYGLKYFTKSKTLYDFVSKKFPNIVERNFDFNQYHEEKSFWDENIIDVNKDIEDLNARATNNDFAKSQLKARYNLEATNDKSHGIYNIAKNQWDNILKQLEKCKALIGDFEYKIIGEDVIDQHHDRLYGDAHLGGGFSDTWNIKIPVYKVEIKCTVKENDWVVCAIVKHVDGQNGVTITPIKQKDGINIPSLPDKFFGESGIFCDHCHTNRDRNLGFIVYNTKTNEFKQVGKACLKLYTGISPAGLLALNNVYNTLESEVWEGGRGKLKTCSLHDALEYSYAATKVFGYIKSSAAYSTKDLVLDMIYGFGPTDKDTEDYKKAMKVFDYLYKNEKSIKEDVEKIISFIKNDYDSGDIAFNNNLKTVVSGDIISINQIGIACCIPNLYFRSQDKAKSGDDSNVIIQDTGPKYNKNISYFYYDGNEKKEGTLENSDYWIGYGTNVIIPRSAIYKITYGSKTRYNSYPLTIYVRGNQGDNNKCGKISTFVDNPNINLDGVVEVTGIANGTNNFNDHISAKLKDVVFVTKSLKDKINDIKKYNVGDRINIKIKSAEIGELRPSDYGGYWAYIDITDEDDNNFTWSCSSDSILNKNEKELVGKTLKATIKSVKTTNNSVSYVITRGKLQESTFSKIYLNANYARNLSILN